MSTHDEILYNNGFITALALFYAHRFNTKLCHPKDNYDFRIYAGSDHLYQIELPKNLPSDLRERIEKFVNTVQSLRYDATPKQAEELFEECLNILKELDERLFGLKVTVVYP
jgi:hypothetical protein